MVMSTYFLLVVGVDCPRARGRGLRRASLCAAEVGREGFISGKRMMPGCPLPLHIDAGIPGCLEGAL